MAITTFNQKFSRSIMEYYKELVPMESYSRDTTTGDETLVLGSYWDKERNNYGFYYEELRDFQGN